MEKKEPEVFVNQNKTLIFAPAKTGQGRMKEGVEFTWRRRSGGVDDDL